MIQIKNRDIINQSVYGIGRRKKSTAIVHLVPFSQTNLKTKLEVNGSLGNYYFQENFTYLSQILLPLKTVNLIGKYRIVARVKGGGLTGQAQSIKLGLARALCKLDKINYRPVLKSQGLLSRDARVKERRKYGLKKARKASQYSKR